MQVDLLIVLAFFGLALTLDTSLWFGRIEEKPMRRLLVCQRDRPKELFPEPVRRKFGDVDQRFADMPDKPLPDSNGPGMEGDTVPSTNSNATYLDPKSPHTH